LVLLAVVAATPVALNGGVLLMVAGGLASALLVLIAGVVGERAGTHHMGALTGLAERTPRLAILAGLGALAALGLPGLGTFGGEFLVFLGAYPQERVGTVLVLAATVILAAVLIWSVERIFFGPIGEAHQRLRDMGPLDLTYGVTLVSLLVLLGIFPSLLTDNITFGVLNLLSRGTG
jgi:NADH-quinone oxidoreductase subunit M